MIETPESATQKIKDALQDPSESMRGFGRVARMGRFTLFWIYFWHRIGWDARAQWIIIQHIERSFFYGDGKGKPKGFMAWRAK